MPSNVTENYANIENDSENESQVPSTNNATANMPHTSPTRTDIRDDPQKLFIDLVQSICEIPGPPSEVGQNLHDISGHSSTLTTQDILQALAPILKTTST